MSQDRTLRSRRIVPCVDTTKNSPQPVKVLTLYFHEAVVQRNNNSITEDEYLKALLSHCSGTRHGRNRLCNNDERPKPGFVKSGFADNFSDVDNFTVKIAYWILQDVCKRDTRTIDSAPHFPSINSYSTKENNRHNPNIPPPKGLPQQQRLRTKNRPYGNGFRLRRARRRRKPKQNSLPQPRHTNRPRKPRKREARKARDYRSATSQLSHRYGDRFRCRVSTPQEE